MRAYSALRELYSELCGDLSGKEIQKGGYICIHAVDSFCCIVEMNTILQSSYCCSVARSCPTLRPHGLQHARLPCPSPSPGVCSVSCPLMQWCHPTISFSAAPFSSCLQSFPSITVFSKKSALCITWQLYSEKLILLKRKNSIVIKSAALGLGLLGLWSCNNGGG